MGLIKTALNSAGGALQDQFKEYITCDSLDASIIMKKGLKKTREKNVNNGMVDIISNGSTIQVADGQIAIVVTNGKVSDIIGEPGIFKYTNDQAASNQMIRYLYNSGANINYKDEVYKLMQEGYQFSVILDEKYLKSTY